MFHTFRKYKFCTFTVVSQDSQRFAICQYSVSQGFAKKEICKVSQIGFSFRKVCKVFAMGIGHVQGCQSRCTPGARASDSRPCRRRLWPSALLTLRLRVEAGQHPRTPPHRPRRSLRRPRPPCSLRPHCPFYPFSTKLEVWSLWWVVNVTLVPLASLYFAQDVVLKHFVVHSAKALKFLAIQDVTVDPGHWHDSDSVRLLLRQLICWARHRVATDAQVETADSGIAEPVTLVNGGR